MLKSPGASRLPFLARKENALESYASRTWPLAAVLFVASTMTHAQTAAPEQQLQEVVVSASGFEQQIKDAPASISVITRQDLETKRITSIADALADVEGIDTGDSAGKTGGLNISMRGLGNDYTLILIDGRRQNSTGNIYPNGFGEARNNFLPPVSAIERIEIIRGPMATLYGSDAMGGVVNIITKKVGKEWNGSVTVDGTFLEDSKFGDSRGAEVFLSGPIKEGLLGLQVRGRKASRDQSSIAYALDDGTEGPELDMGRNPTKSRSDSFGARLTLTPNKDHDLWLDVDSSKQWFDNSRGQLGTLGTAGGYGPAQEYTRDKILLAHNWRTNSGVLESSISYNETETQGRLIPARLIGRSGDRNLTSKDLIVDTKFVTAFGNHTMIVGGQYWDAKMADGILPSETKFRQISAFLEDEWRFRPDLALTVGVRHDDHDTFGGYTTPRAYLVWNANDNWTFKGGAAGGYKAPRLEYLTYGIYSVGQQGRGPQIGNPDLKPETSTNLELSAIFDSLKGFNAGATVFKSEYKDFISTSLGPQALPTCVTGTATEAACEAYLAGFGSYWDMGYRNYPLSTGPADSFTLRRPVNISKARIQGIELFTRWQFANDWNLSANYTYTDSKQLSGDNYGDPINNTPKHMLNSTLRWQANDKLATWIRGEYRSSGYRDGTHAPTGQSAQEVIGGWKSYALLHLGGSYKATKNVTLSATVFNVFDTQFNKAVVVDGTTYATYRNNQEPRRLWLSANYSF
ncbi:MAG: TonB-dependent receptor [Oxalicibacterium faecigallinarum]|uniref:TonB-dependent receptor domain-containing protein n=1 Tax=Oxalicibacterium faecigallinarum TaxID=573741 RepID=UPI002809DAB7|nr:TonB-dependent receptor [Oxalicibacterium faecigallinarum]MDQ7969330.1 TonB-dependent receptor [Oxalicibacterium faecigallinarum]